MLTDDEARRLLQHAGETVEVDPTRPVPEEPRRSPWPILLAAAAVVVIAVTSVVVTTRGGSDEPDPAPAAPGDGRFRLGPDQVPSVFGLTADQAVELLEQRGLDARVETKATCNEVTGRAMSTIPRTGTLVSPGDEVTVVTPDPGVRGCLPGDSAHRELAWQFLDFAAGRGDAPAFADDVVVYDGDVSTTLTRERAADPGAWPGLDEVNTAATEVQRWKGSSLAFTTPGMGAQLLPGSGCGQRPPELRRRRGLAVTIGVPLDGVMPGRCLQVTLFRDHAGEIDSVLVTGRALDLDLPGPPDVVGNSLAYARERLASAGYEVDDVARPDCGQVGTVAAQTPTWGEPADPGSTVTIGVIDEQTRCDSSPLVVPTPSGDAADALVAFARGDAGPPPVADRVEVYVADTLDATLTADDATDPDSWAPVLAPLRGPVATSAGAGVAEDGCLVRGDLPDSLAESDAIRLSKPESATCADDWSLLVWVDPGGAISAVDLLRGEQTTPTAVDHAARRLESFARGGDDLPSMADEVDLYVGGAFTGFVTRDSATDRQAWQTCTEIGTYAGRDCPFSPLDVLRDRGGATVVVDDPPWTCLARYDDTLPGVASADSAAIVPTRAPSGCAGTFAVQVFVNADGELIAVDLLLPRP